MGTVVDDDAETAIEVEVGSDLAGDDQQVPKQLLMIVASFGELAERVDQVSANDVQRYLLVLCEETISCWIWIFSDGNDSTVFAENEPIPDTLAMRTIFMMRFFIRWFRAAFVRYIMYDVVTDAHVYQILAYA